MFFSGYFRGFQRASKAFRGASEGFRKGLKAFREISGGFRGFNQSISKRVRKGISVDLRRFQRVLGGFS